MRLQMNLDIQVARRAPVHAGFAIACRANPHAVVDTGRYLDLQRLVLAYAADAITRNTRIGDFLAGAVAGGTCLLHAEKTLLHAHRPTAVAGVARFGMRAGFGARPM